MTHCVIHPGDISIYRYPCHNGCGKRFKYVSKMKRRSYWRVFIFAWSKTYGMFSNNTRFSTYVTNLWLYRGTKHIAWFLCRVSDSYWHVFFAWNKQTTWFSVAPGSLLMSQIISCITEQNILLDFCVAWLIHIVVFLWLRDAKHTTYFSVHQFLYLGHESFLAPRNKTHCLVFVSRVWITLQCFYFCVKQIHDMLFGSTRFST